MFLYERWNTDYLRTLDILLCHLPKTQWLGTLVFFHNEQCHRGSRSVNTYKSRIVTAFNHFLILILIWFFLILKLQNIVRNAKRSPFFHPRSSPGEQGAWDSQLAPASQPRDDHLLSEESSRQWLRWHPRHPLTLWPSPHSLAQGRIKASQNCVKHIDNQHFLFSAFYQYLCFNFYVLNVFRLATGHDGFIFNPTISEERERERAMR